MLWLLWKVCHCEIMFTLTASFDLTDPKYFEVSMCMNFMHEKVTVQEIGQGKNPCVLT